MSQPSKLDKNFLPVTREAQRTPAPINYAEGKLNEESWEAICRDLRNRLAEQESTLARIRAQLREETQARKQTEIALHESEERFMLFMNHSPLMTFIKDDRGNYVYGNKRWQSVFGRELSATRVCTDFDLYSRKNAGRICKEDREILATGKNSEIIRSRPAGKNQLNSWLTVKFPYFDPRGRPFIGGVALDITDRKRGAAELKSHATQQATIAKFGQQALSGASPQCLMDEAAALVSTILRADFCAVSELQSERKKLCVRSIKPTQRGEIQSTFSTDAGSQMIYLLRKRRPIFIEDLAAERRFQPSPFLLQHKLVSGMEVIISRSKDAWGVLSVFTRKKRIFSKGEMHFVQAMANTLAAAMERKDAEWALRQSEATLKDFFDNAPVGLHLLGPDGSILRTNKAELLMLGYSADEYVGHHVSHFHVDKQVINEVLDKLPTNRIQNYEARVRCKDGSIKNVVIDLNVLWDEGRFIHARCFSRDITGQRQRERQILEISEREQQRIGQDLHDELCQYLAAIKFKCGLLQRRLARSKLAQAREAGLIETMLNRSIDQAHSLARGLSPVQVEAGGLVSALKELAAHQSNIYDCDCYCRMGKISAVKDATIAIHIYRIAQEATINAIKHGKAGRVAIRLMERNAQLILSVEDDGIGFVPDNNRKTGMGLHLMNYRARTIGATIAIKPGREGGTILTCTLPHPPSTKRSAK
ncbi:PAS domain S-box protein [Pedosphaera parvula]|uniref:Multi-sensor signal transduction histidine kinase n=1 Tax=Pedosphaera parvula (strain Ellin514) TaxID=320771 RepID=B9XAW4_PEDPL|nr:PAS domain S-box protein [Pedosphaera parvula]EEF63149.1 multi-sensor signal transduction histidine kinase [Pedosphaera parvula Ellin514]